MGALVGRERNQSATGRSAQWTSWAERLRATSVDVLVTSCRRGTLVTADRRSCVQPFVAIAARYGGRRAHDSRALVVAVLVLGGLVLPRERFEIRRVVRGSHPQVAALELVAPPLDGRGGESFEMGEHRRRQRIDAASRMLNHLVSRRDLDRGHDRRCSTCSTSMPPSSSRAPGSSVRPWRSVASTRSTTTSPDSPCYFEDRYGVGDEIVVESGDGVPVNAVVDHIGLFSDPVAGCIEHAARPEQRPIAAPQPVAGSGDVDDAVARARRATADEAMPTRQRPGRHRRADRRDLRRRPRGSRAEHRAGRSRSPHARGPRRPSRSRCSSAAPSACSTSDGLGCDPSPTTRCS